LVRGPYYFCHIINRELSDLPAVTGAFARGQTGKGANLSLFGGAFEACVAGGQTG